MQEGYGFVNEPRPMCLFLGTMVTLELGMSSAQGTARDDGQNTYKEAMMPRPSNIYAGDLERN